MELLPDSAFDDAVATWSPAQQQRAREVRAAIVASAAELRERVQDGRWLTGYVVYEANGSVVAAIGPTAKDTVTVHLMPYYGSVALRERHADALERFASGKSCLRFRPADHLPAAAITAVVAATPAYLEAVAAFAASRSKKNR